MAEFSKDLAGIQMHLLFYSPMRAAIEAQKLMARNMIAYIDEMAYGETGGGEKSKAKPAPKMSKSRKVRTLDMQLERPVTRPDGTVGTQKISVKPPILGLVPLQSLLINEVTVSFSISVESNVTVDEKNTSDGDPKLTTVGKVSAQRENTRKTDKTGKYDVSLTAAQQDATEGMGKLMEIMASCVEPINLEADSDS